MPRGPWTPRKESHTARVGQPGWVEAGRAPHPHGPEPGAWGSPHLNLTWAVGRGGNGVSKVSVTGSRGPAGHSPVTLHLACRGLVCCAAPRPPPASPAPAQPDGGATCLARRAPLPRPLPHRAPRPCLAEDTTSTASAFPHPVLLISVAPGLRVGVKPLLVATRSGSCGLSPPLEAPDTPHSSTPFLPQPGPASRPWVMSELPGPPLEPTPTNSGRDPAPWSSARPPPRADGPVRPALTPNAGPFFSRSSSNP